MPIIELTTNIPVVDGKALCLELSKLAADTMSKDEAYISVYLDANKPLTFNASFEPAYLMKVVRYAALDNLTPENNQKYSKAFSEFLTAKLGIPNDRGYVMFMDPKAVNIGYKATTHQVLLDAGKIKF